MAKDNTHENSQSGWSIIRMFWRIWKVHRTVQRYARQDKMLRFSHFSTREYIKAIVKSVPYSDAWWRDVDIVRSYFGEMMQNCFHSTDDVCCTFQYHCPKCDGTVSDEGFSYDVAHAERWKYIRSILDEHYPLPPITSQRTKRRGRRKGGGEGVIVEI